ncbi:MAG: ABC transporter ATP-binding protein [Planctomycetota bacterium]
MSERASAFESATGAVVSRPAGGDEAVLVAQGLVKRFGAVLAVDHVSFRVARGELVGFLGPNGAGKSTTMRMLTGSLEPDEGDALVLGRPAAGGDLGARRAVGYLPENTPLYREMRVDRYLEFVGRLHGLSGARRRDAIARVIAATDLDGYTQRRIHTLSKGYRQRVGLAQALLSDPVALILDEPTSGLDPGEIVRIRDLVVQLAREKTILLSTHVLPEVEEVCRRVVILAGGRVVADGGLLELADGVGEALSVTVGGLTGAAHEAAARVALAAVEGVARVEVAARGEAGRVRFLLAVEGRFEAAERVARSIHAGAFSLVELRHEVATLERIFLERTRGVQRRATAAESAPSVSGPFEAAGEVSLADARPPEARP